MRLFLVAVMGLSLFAAGCGDDDVPRNTIGVEHTAENLFPDVIDATATHTDGTWTISATISSPYDSAERYADAWRVLGPDGEELAVRELAHDHATEQPFTRSLGGIEIDPSITEVTIEGRDQVSGWGGSSFVLSLDEAADS